jgi:hypothetical protein
MEEDRICMHFFRRDFRANKLDLTTGNIAVNPVTWSNIAVQFEVISFEINYSMVHFYGFSIGSD